MRDGVLADVRTEIRAIFDRVNERLRVLEITMPTKVNRKFVDAFVRKMMVTVQEIGAKAAIADRMPREEENEGKRAAGGAKESVPVSRSEVTCLVCDSKRPGRGAESSTGARSR
jgi:predicted metal-dependent hydrolase